MIHHNKIIYNRHIANRHVHIIANRPVLDIYYRHILGTLILNNFSKPNRFLVHTVSYGTGLMARRSSLIETKR